MFLPQPLKSQTIQLLYMDDNSGTIEIYASGHKNIYARSSKNNPRNQACPRCKRENVLTPEDIRRGNVCRTCDKEIIKEQRKKIKEWLEEWVKEESD